MTGGTEEPGEKEPSEAAVAWQLLQQHRTVADTGDCVVCGVSGPCAVANDAAALLAALGVPVVERNPTLPDPPSPSRRRAARLTSMTRFWWRGRNRGQGQPQS